MKLRILTLSFDPEMGRFDDGMVREFLADKELLGVQDHFFGVARFGVPGEPPPLSKQRVETLH